MQSCEQKASSSGGETQEERKRKVLHKELPKVRCWPGKTVGQNSTLRVPIFSCVPYLLVLELAMY